MDQHREPVADAVEQPEVSAFFPHRHIVQRRAGRHVAGEGVIVRRVEVRLGQEGWHRKAARIDQRAGEGMVTGQRQHCVAEVQRVPGFRRNEVGRPRRVHDVLVGGEDTLLGIAVEQAVRRLAVKDQLELPAQVVAVLDSRVGAARADEKDQAVAELLHAAALEGVDAYPFKIEFAAATEHGPDPGNDLFRLLLLLRVRLPAELEIDAVDVVGLAVQEHRLPRMEGRIEPEPALGGKFGLHHHVGDQETVGKDPAFAVQVHHAPDRAARAVGDDQPVGSERVGAIRRFDLECRSVFRQRNRNHLVPEAQIEIGQFAGAPDQEFLEVVLLQVDHSRTLVVGLRQQVEVVDIILAKEGTADVPAHALVHAGIADAEAVEYLERALGIANAARANRNGIVIVEDDDRHARLRQIDRRRQADRSGADH